MKKNFKIAFSFILMFIFNMNVNAATIEENIDSIISRVATYEAQAFLDTHPVGSIYITTASDENTATKMASKYGGTWAAFGTDRTLRGTTGTASSTGGASTRSLAVANLPAHTHTVPALSGSTNSYGSGYSPGGISYTTRITKAPTAETINANYSGYSTSSSFNSSYFYYIKTQAGTSSELIETGIASNIFTITATHEHTFTDYFINTISGVNAHTHSYNLNASTTTATGSGSSFSILDPYITVYMYKRTT